MRSPLSVVLFSLFGCILPVLTNGYQVLISDTDDVRQVCSGMWQKIARSRDPYIEIFFGPASKGQLALVVYEWQDAKYLGLDSSNRTTENNWEGNRTYLCTLDAIAQSMCTMANLGEFIISPLPPGRTVESTSIWTKSITLEPHPKAAGSHIKSGEMIVGPWRYNVTKTGYYCVGTVPLTVRTSNNNSSFSAYTGVVDFENIFEGNLPAGEYPKVAFYGFVSTTYLLLAILWTINCYRHRTEILPVQHYISACIVFLMIEMTTVSGYYKYLNGFGSPGMTRALLVLVSILGAARNAISFFILLIVSLGYSVVKESLGPVMLRVRLLAIAHFIFAVLYAMGMSIFPFETAGLWVFVMVFPLAFTLTAFMMWIMAALSHTIQSLESRKQTHKKQMFVRLHRILIGAALVIVIFFFVSSISFSNRLQQDFAPDTWSTRWFILDGWLALLYMVCFVSIAYLWRPTERNRYLAMSDELAQDEEAADDYDVQREHGAPFHENDDDGKGWASLPDGGDALPLQLRVVRDDSVVFDIGEDDDAVPQSPTDDTLEDPDGASSLLKMTTPA